jgi:hypothetical protein
MNAAFNNETYSMRFQTGIILQEAAIKTDVEMLLRIWKVGVEWTRNRSYME